MLKRILISLGALGVLAFIIVQAKSCAMSEEDRVRELINGAVDAFNAADREGIVDVFRDDWVDESSELNLVRLRYALSAAFYQQSNFASGRFRFRVVNEGFESVVVNEDDDSAHVAFVVATYAKLSTQANWRAQVECDLERDGGEWRIVRTRHTTRDGRRPFR